MSCPANPLSKYRSYNYQQILIATDTTETAERLAASNQFLDYTRTQDADRENTPQNPYAKYRPYDINLDKGRTGQYVILINGMQDAEFIISKAHWYNTVAADAGGEGNQYSTYNISGEIEISEPQGIRFLNVISEVADSLGSDPPGLIFLLKTVFIGYRTPTFEDDGFPDPITNIRPNILKLTNITGTFTVTGGDYKIEFAGINHGASKEQHIMHANDRIKFNLANTDIATGCESSTLAGALCQLQNKIGIIYDDYYDSIKKEIEDTTDANGKKLIFNGRRVQYVIQAEEPLNGPEYLVTDFRDSATNTGETGKGGIIDVSFEPSVEAAILAISKRCPKIQEDLVVGDGKDSKITRYIMKVSTTIQSTDTEYKIIYKLRRVVESREDMLAILSNRVSDDADDLNVKIKENILTLDYMYTGKNTDILDFDIKMDMGLVLFTNLTTTDNIPNTAESINGGNPNNALAHKNPLEVKATANGRLRPGTPIFLSTKVERETLPHVTNPKRTIDFQELVNRHAALENLEAVVKIHGNPGLLNTVNKTPTEIIETTKFSDTQSNTDPLQGKSDKSLTGAPRCAGLDVEYGNQDPFPYWETIPAIVQININMPSVFYGGAQNTNDFAESFWYRGFYYCYAIEQFFSDGEFTQTLHLVSLPKNSSEDNTQKDQNQTDQIAQTDKANQDTKTAGTGTGASTPSEQPNVSTSGDSLTSGQYQKANSG